MIGSSMNCCSQNSEAAAVQGGRCLKSRLLPEPQIAISKRRPDFADQIEKQQKEQAAKSYSHNSDDKLLGVAVVAFEG